MEDSDSEDEGHAPIYVVFFMLMITQNNLELKRLLSMDSSAFMPLWYRRARCGTIRRGALHDPTESTFHKVYKSGHDDALISMTGLNFMAFGELLSLFRPLFEVYTPHGSTRIRRVEKSSGRKRILSAEACLGLVLTWLRSRGPNRVLCFLFGIIPGTCSVYLRFAKRILIRVLKDIPGVTPSMPDRDEAEAYVDAIHELYPILTDVWGAMDGLRLQIESPPNLYVQNRYYNSWKESHQVTNLFVFAPNGKICAVYMNAPGCIHDSTMATLGGIYEKIDAVFDETSYRVVADSAFIRWRPSILISNQNSMNPRTGCMIANPSVNRAATSVRQMSEWGMRAVQGSFPRVKDKIKWEDRGERKLLIQLVVYLYNYRSNRVGLNQIKTTFMPHLQRTANEFLLMDN